MSAQVVVVGFGLGFNQRLHHCDVIENTAGLRLRGICDLGARCREEATRLYDVRVYAGIEEVLSDAGVDVLVVATPNHTHAPIALQCLEAGKHVVLEKPMCLTTQEADALVDASRRNGCVLTVRYNRRWDGDYLTVKQVVEAGTLGQVLSVDSAMNTLIKPSSWRAQTDAGGGELYDWGSHLVDQVLQLVPSEPRAVFAVMKSWGWDTEVDTYARVTVQFRDGSLSEVEASNISWLPRPRWHVLGENGSLAYRDGRFRLRTSSEDTEILPGSGDEGEFYRNVSGALNDGEGLLVTPEESRKVVAVIEAAVLSAEGGKVVQL